MDLQPVKKLNAEGIPGRGPVQLTEQQQQLINIQTAPAKLRRVIVPVEAYGIVQHDQNTVETISAWTAGRVEKLYVGEEETDVLEGDRLYSLFSPELYSGMQDYIKLRQMGSSQTSFVDSARLRLRQLGLKPEQIEELDSADQAPVNLDVRSPISGKVMRKMVKEGDYVKEGTPLYTLVDLSRLWLMADVYEADLPYVQKGQRVVAATPSVPNDVFTGTVELINHHIDEKTRTVRLRIVLDPDNQSEADSQTGRAHHQHDHRLLPGMWMTARLEHDLGQRLTIPREAVFDTGRRQHVFMEKESGVFVPRMIQSNTIGSLAVVTSGLQPGEKVVTDGTFLLDSESLLKASASGSEDEQPEDQSQSLPGLTIAPAVPLPEPGQDALKRLLSSYEAMRKAFAEDDLATAKTALEPFKRQLEELATDPSLGPLIHKARFLDLIEATRNAVNAASMESHQEARDSFGHISHGIIALLSEFPVPSSKDWIVANCPMWKSAPGSWIQIGEELENPFMGARMLRCGTVERTLGSSSN